jgi:CBS domain-containing protein
VIELTEFAISEEDLGRPLSVRPQDSLRSVLDAMVAHRIREIPVTDEVVAKFD